MRAIYFVVMVFMFSCTQKTKQIEAIQTETKSKEISISGSKIMLGDSQYIIKGICYNPVPKNSTQRNFDSLTEDIALMLEASVNTIRVYLPIDDKQVLDELYEAGIMVIMGFGYNQGGVYDMLSGTYIDYINKYKDHPAILMWELGNEYNYHPEWFGGDLKNWYIALNIAADTIKMMETGKPVATAHGELPDSLALAMCPDIEVWGMNVYRWDNPSTIFEEWENVSSKPMYLSEAGADSYMTKSTDVYSEGSNEKAQADAMENILANTFPHPDICSGVALFAFSDEWWKAGNSGQQDPGGWAPNSSGVPYDGSPNEEYWGIVDIDRNKKEAFDTVKKHFTKSEK